MTDEKHTETEEEREARIRRARRRKEIQRKRRRRKQIVRLSRIVLAVILIIAAVLAVSAGIRRIEKNKADKAAAAKTLKNIETAAASDVLHLSFPMLTTDENTDPAGTGGTSAGDTGTEALTPAQLTDILSDLYEKNYVLIDFYDIAGTAAEENATADIEVPEGKKPLVISEYGLSYTKDPDGHASGMLTGADGKITNQYVKADGSVAEGAYDVVPVVEAFIVQHPDFSYNGARGVIGLNGSSGVLGYSSGSSAASAALSSTSSQTASPSQASSSSQTAGSSAAADTDLQKTVKTLKSSGWHFASSSYQPVSYGSETEIVEKDADMWQASVGKAVGGTDILLLPDKADIGPWSGYTEDNSRYQYLKKLGFIYFCIDDPEEFTWLQTGTDYVRQGVHDIENMQDYQTVMNLG